MVRKSLSRNTKTPRSEKDSLYRRFLRRWTLHLEQLEDRIAPATLANAGTVADQIYNLPGGPNVVEFRHVSGDNFIIDSQNATFDDTTIAVSSPGTSSVTINLGGSGDTITLTNLSFSGSTIDNKLTVTGGAGNDTVKLDDNWGVGVTLKEAAAGGTADTLDFDLFSDAPAPRSAITIAPQLGGGVHINAVAPDTSTLILDSTSAANFESLTNANIDLSSSAKTTLTGGLNSLSTFAHDIADVGQFATSLPLLGKNANVTVAKALGAAEAVDELRFEVQHFIDSHPNVTTDDLNNQLNSIFSGTTKTLSHLGAAVVSPEGISDSDIATADVYKFKLVLDDTTTVTVIADVDADPAPSVSGGGTTVTVGFDRSAGASNSAIDPEDRTVANLVAALNLGLSTLNATAGGVFATQRDGRIAFQVLSTEINKLSVEGLVGALPAEDQSISKLGFNLGVPVVLDNVKEVLRNLGDLNLSTSSPISLDVQFASGTPQLRFNVHYLADRTSDFFYNLGKQAQSIGLAFDLQAKITAKAEMAFDFKLGLDLGSAGASFFLDVDQLRAGIKTTVGAETVSGVGLNVGFLGVKVSGSLTVDAGVVATLSTTTHISVASLTDPGVSLLTGGSLALHKHDGTGSPAFNLTLNASVDAGVSDLGGFTASATLTASGNPFDGSDITITPTADFSKFFDFNRLNAAGVVSLLGQLSSWLDGVRKGGAINSINIPFVKGGLDKVLDLAEVFSDALLFDEGPDDVRDGADKLATDVNAALAAAHLDRLIRAEGDGSKIDLIAIDPHVTAFSIAIGPGDAGGFTQAGFTAGAASGTGILKKTGAAGPLLGKLANDAVIHFSITRDSATTLTDVSLTKASTDDNKGIGDDKPKLLDVNNAPTFANTQEFADRLSQIITLGLVHYDVANKLLTFKISFTDVSLFSVDLPTDFSIDLGSIANVQSNTHLILDAKGGLNLTLGFDLNDTPLGGGSTLTDATTLDSLDVKVKKEEAITADGTPRSIIGQTSGDAAFGISFNGGSTGTSSGASSSSTVLHDPLATFVTDGVRVGDFVRNKSENSLVRVTEVTDQTHLKTAAVTNWSGDQYLLLAAVTVPQFFGQAGTDVNVSKGTGDQSETAIAVNPINPNNIVIGANDLNSTDGLSSPAANDIVWVSFDGGSSWARKIVPIPVVATAGSSGDPALVFSRDGSRVVYTHMVNKASGDTAIASAVSLDGGNTWLQANTSVIGTIANDDDGDGFNDNNDKNYIAVGPDLNDTTKDRFVVTWQRHGVIFATHSADGQAWTVPVVVGGLTRGSSTAAPAGDSIDAIPTFGPNGEIFVVWEDFGTGGVAKLKFDVSLDGGTTWGGGRDANVFFNTADFALDAGDKAILDQVANNLNGNPQLIVTVAGYTDTAGLDASNQTLSDNRAQAVFDYLTITKGISATRVTKLGFGESHLAAATADGVDNAANRRVEVRFDQIVYTGNVNVFRDPFNAGMGLDGVDEGAADGLGEYEIPAQPNRGILAGVSIAVDRSGGAHQGRIYIAFTDQGDLDGDPDAANAVDHNNTDVFIIASDNVGKSFDALGAGPTRVNDDVGTSSQFFSWMGVDQSTGNVAVSWYDARNDPGAGGGTDTDGPANTDVQYFASFSVDGGAHWAKNLKISDGASNVTAARAPASTVANQYGDYSGLAFVNNTFFMAWADNSNSTSDNADFPVPPGTRTTEVYFDRVNLVNTSITDLVADINAVIANTPLLAGKFQAQADGNTLKIVAISPLVTSFDVETTKTDTAFRELGFQEMTDAVSVGGSLTVKAGKDAPAQIGQLTADASFDLNLGSGAKTITVKREDTVSQFGSNHSILDLVNDVQKAIDDPAAFGPGVIEVSTTGGHLLFTRIGAITPGPSDSFTITPGAHADELGILSALTSDEADLIITTQDGAKHRVVLDTALNIGDVISAINAVDGGVITASKTVDDPEGKATPANEANTGLTLVDGTSGSTVFVVATANGSIAGSQLSIVGMDTTDEAADPKDGKIIGGKIAGATLLDRFFITSDDLTDVIDAKLSVSAGIVLSGIKITAESGGKTTIEAKGFDFTKLDAAAVTAGDIKIKIKGVAGFVEGTYTVTDKIDATHVKVMGHLGTVNQEGGAGILQNGVQASANFGFVGINLSGSAALGAKLKLGFNTNAAALSDSRLTLQELVDGISQGNALALLAPPDITPLTGTDFGNVDLKVGLSVAGGDFSALSAQLLGANPGVSIKVVTLGDPFLDTRFTQANYAKVDDTTFHVDGDFTAKLPIGVKIRFTVGGVSHDLKVTSAAFLAGKTNVTVDLADPMDPAFAVPADLTGISVTLQPKVDITTTGLTGLPDFSNLSFKDIIAALQALSGFLGQFESFGFLNTKLPIVNESVNDLLAFANKFTTSLDNAQNNPAGTLQVLENKLNEAVGISSSNLTDIFTFLGEPVVPGLSDDPFDLSLDTSDPLHHLLKLDFSLGTQFSKALDLSIPGIDFGGALASLGLGSLLDLSGGAGLKAEGAVLLRLTLGFDVSGIQAGDFLDPSNLLDRLYILDTTGLKAKLSIGAQDIAFRVGVGPFALSVANDGATHAMVDIEGTASGGIKPSSFTNIGPTNHKLKINSLGLSDFQATLGGTVTGTLPVFFPTDSTKLGNIKIGGSDGAGAFTASGNLANFVTGNGLDLRTQNPDPSAKTDAIVIDVSDIVSGISTFDFSKFNFFDNIFLAVDGVDSVLGFVQDLVGGKIGSLTIPLIGSGLSKGAHFIQDLRDNFIAPLRAGIEKAKDAAQDFADPDKNVISKLLFDLLGPSGLHLLQPLDGSLDAGDDSPADFIGLNTNLNDFLFNPNTTLTLQDTFIEWNVKLGDNLVDANTDIGFDLGVPGLGLKTEGAIHFNLQWLLNLGFGLSFKDGFYLKIDDPHELAFDASVTLPGGGITGSLGFLGLKANDKTIDGHNTELGATFVVDVFQKGAVPGSDDAKKLSFTELGKIGLNAGIAADAAASLGFQLGLSPDLFVKLFGPGANKVISGFPKLSGDFVFLWEIGNRTGATLQNKLSSSTFVALDGDANTADGSPFGGGGFSDAIQAGLKKVAFENVGLDVGSFLSDVLGPIVKEVGKFTAPIQPLIDFITSPIPIVGQLGLNITWLDLAASLGGFDAGFIKSVADIITLINKINSLSNSGAVILPIGDMMVFNDTGVGTSFKPHLWDSKLDLDNTFNDIKGAAGLLNSLVDALPGGIGEALGDLGGQAAEALGGVVGGSSASGFDFPFLKNPSEIFGMLMGKPARLVTYDLAPLAFNFDFHVFFPIFGPLGVSIGLKVDFTLDTAFGYDTQGIQDFVGSGFRNPGLLFNGFYIDASPKQNGKDDPELKFNVELQAAAELNLGVARAGVAAALGFTINFNLFDPNKDGRIRISEIIGNFENQLKAPSDADKLLAPLAIFDISGEIYAKLFIFLEINLGFFTFKKDFPIYGPTTLLSFNVDFFRPPTLASEQDTGDLIINTGKFAKNRLLGNATDVAENLIIQSDGTDGDYVKVKIKAGDGANSTMGEDADVFQDYKVKKGQRIIIDGGEGDDTFDLSGFTESGVLLDADLGVGNDKLKWGAGGGVPGKFNKIHGGTGDDEIDGSDGSDLIFGDGGNDTIKGFGGDDLIFGDEGEIKDGMVRGLVKPTDGGDIIDAGGGKDIVFGGGGKDDLKGGTSADADLIIGGGGLVSFNNATDFTVFGNVKALSAGGVKETENKAFDPTAGDKISGGDGDDLLFGTAGPDNIMGEGGKDTIFGGLGFDTIDGGAGNDLIFGDGGVIAVQMVMGVPKDVPTPTTGGSADIIQGGAGNDLIFGGDGGDSIQGGDNDDEIHGGSGPDIIFGDNGHITGGVAILDPGVDGKDKVFGEGEPDLIYGGGGIDQLDGGAGADKLYGGDDSDLLITNKGNDFLNGENGSDTYQIFYQGGKASSLTKVLDTGSTGVDIFVATGTIFNDNFLLRSDTTGALSFVALINSTTNVERTNYSGVERVVVNGSFGDDYFAADDTAAEVTLNGEFGNDTFQIGQMFKSERTVVDANVAVDDVFATIETTRGFLSNGISKPMTINGGVGDDHFVVYHNKAVLQLNGEEGDDVFEIRAFALAGSQEPQRERTDISGGAGADLIQYAVNAPVNIDGGDGFDTVILIGTEFGDDFVITRDGVFGAGLNVNYVNIESLRVDGAEGNDRFFVESTSEKFVTEIDGGLGSDTFNMSGDTPPVVSNDLKGHSGIVVHNVESMDPRFDQQTLFGISANVADNDEPAIVIRQSGGSTIVTETNTTINGAVLIPDGATLTDSYTIVLTRQPTKNVYVKALAPIPTPGDRERRIEAFRLDSPTKDSVTLDGTGLTLKFTTSNWYIPQTVNILADATPVSDTTNLFTRMDIDGGSIPLPFDMDDDAFEGTRSGVVNHIVQAESTNLLDLLTAVNNATPSVTIPDPGGVTTGDLLGRKILISEGPGAGQLRFIVGAVDNGTTFTLTLDRAFLGSDVPTTISKYFISIDDALTGKMSAFNESPSGLPAISDPLIQRSTFTDSSASFPTAGEGLTGGVLEIVGGPGAGQQRLILGNLSGDATHTLILNGPWRTDPVAGQSIYRIQRYDGLNIPSVTVQINDNDRAGVQVDETKGFQDNGNNVPDAADVVADSDTVTAVIEGGNGDHLGEQDVVRVRLSRDPGGSVELGLIYDGAQMLLQDFSGILPKTINNTDGNRLSFDSSNWSVYQNVLVKALADGVREGFNTSLIQFQIVGGSGDQTLSNSDTFQTVLPDSPIFYVGLTQTPVAASVTVMHDGSALTPGTDFQVISNKVVFLSSGDPTPISGDISVSYNYVKPGFATAFTTPVLVRINDADAPTVLVRETDGSTDVIEVKKGGGAPESIPVAQDTDQSPWIDSYQLVLTAAPTANVVVKLTPTVTKTTRTGGIRHDAVQVAISSTDSRVISLAGGLLQVTFSAADWDTPVVITVKAVDDNFVDGGDTQVFAPHPSVVSGILGPTVVAGAGGRGSLALNAPLMVPGETNRRPSDGTVVSFSANPAGGLGAIEHMTVKTMDLDTKRLALGLASIDDLIGLTVEMSKGNGVDVVLDPTRPREKYDRFWLITAIATSGANKVLTLQNPSQVDVSTLAASAIPNGSSEYAITALSVNFFVDESTQIDYMFVHDQDSPADSKGVLTSTHLGGLNMGPNLVIGGQERQGGITYSELEVLQIDLGSGNNDFTVQGTPTRPDGYQTWTFLNTGNDIMWNGVQGDTVHVMLNAVDQTTTSGIVTSGLNANGTTIFKTTVTIPGPGSFANGALAGQLIRILNDGIGENGHEADGQVRRILDNVGNVLTVDRPWEFIPDNEAFDILNEADGAFAVNTQGGDDTIDASGSTLGIVAFGGLGADHIIGGSGNDIIFGDRGRVDYRDENGAIVTRLGDAPKPITGFVTTQVTAGTLGTITDTGAKLSGGQPFGTSFPVADAVADGIGDDDVGLVGLYVDINNGKGFLQTVRLITANTANTLTIAPNFDTNLDLPGPDPMNPSEYRISTMPENQTDGVTRDPSLLLTIDNVNGSTDIIDAGGGNDQVFGGAGGDDITAGAGNDVVLGDAGRIDRSRDPAAPAPPVVFTKISGKITVPSLLDRVRTIAWDQGGVDTIRGGAGADHLLGGNSGDTIYGDDATGSAGAADLGDVIIGDNGEIKLTNGVVSHIFTTDTTEATGGHDTLSGNAGNDIILGGVNGSSDVISGGADNDILLGDDGELIYDAPADPNLATLDIVRTGNVNLGGPDTISGNAGADLIFGGKGGDTIDAGSEDDMVFGDFSEALLVANQVNFVHSTNLTQGGADIIQGGSQNDILVGGAFGDIIDGNLGDDLIFGDAVQLQNRVASAITNPRFEALTGTLMYDPVTGNALVDGVARNYRNADGSAPSWATWQIQNLYHTLAIQTSNDNSFGNDYIAGGGANDEIFGQLGDDTIQGDGSIASAIAPSPQFVSATVPSFEAATDGSDYIEGGGGNDTILGGLGQDDIIGGSSNMFTLLTPAMRPDGSDVIFGGAGTRIARNDPGDISATGHANDADTILADNGNIVRLVGTAGADTTLATTKFLTFNYDGYGSAKIIPRVFQLLDYTPGVAAAADIGGNDIVKGEGGDDIIHGQTGHDVLFGDGQDDQIFGGAGNDRIYGGSGEDNILGDDGRFVISRNGLTEPLYGVTSVNAQIDITIPGPFTGAWIYITGRLNTTVHLLAPTLGGNDVIFGGLGDDFIHAGFGDDAVSGGEAQAAWYNTLPVGAGFYSSGGYPVADPTNPLGYVPATRKLAAYDANNPLTKINNFFLNFDASDLANVKIEDGKDRIFGDDGNDWLVGGTGNDRMFGGKGDDLINADDNLSTNGGLNNQPDVTAYADRDFVYGGDGLDVMIANTGGDRMFDWGGEFNSYIVPFSPFGEPTVIRAPSPHIQQFILDLGKESGADQLMIEPNGELGFFTHSDPQWQSNHGGPRDPQPGNIGGSRRDTQGGPEDDRGTALPLAAVIPAAAPAAINAGATNSTDVTYNAVYVVPDPSNPSANALFVGGTNANDTILVRIGNSSAYLNVVVNGVDKGQFAVTSNGAAIKRIIIYGYDGNDTVTVNTSVMIDAAIYGDMGNDTLNGGGGNNFLDGGQGDDTLNGFGGRNVLVGGLGKDTLNGGKDYDVLIGGTYKYSADIDAVFSLMATWSGSASYAQRLTDMRNGGVDALYAFDANTIIDDKTVDYLYGNQGQDWYWVFGLDSTDKLQPGELVN